ncbi:MAG: Ig-like domain-containing protein [Bacteroidales bacterium]|nr:Ig-like domain-containing protein [Bacteroidales bacterium]
MQLKLFLRLFIAALLIIIATACAKQGSPSGGPRDKTPPVVVRAVPQNGATGFVGKSITISFDEFISLDKIQEKFMISPPTEKKPLVTIRGKNIVVEIDEKLRDSTTYTLYFQDAVRDLNEGNIFENYQFVFSTGTYIDSLSYSGSVYNSFDLEIPRA